MCNQMVTSEIKELLSRAFCPITSISSHLEKMQVKLILKFKSIPFDYLLTPGRTGKFIPPPWYKGGLMEPPPPLGYLICCNFSKQFCPEWKALDLLPWYILWVVALLEVFDVTKHGRHLGHHLGFYQDLEIR